MWNELVSECMTHTCLAGGAKALNSYVTEVAQLIVLKLEFELCYLPITNLGF